MYGNGYKSNDVCINIGCVPCEFRNYVDIKKIELTRIVIEITLSFTADLMSFLDDFLACQQTHITQVSNRAQDSKKPSKI